jgi:UPF0755 protein
VRAVGRGRRLVILGAVLLQGCSTPADGSAVEVRLPPGSAVAAIADSLAARGVIGSPRWFRFRARLAGVDRSLRPGIYSFRPGQPLTEILAALERGDELTKKVTLPEGGTLWDLARVVEAALGIPADSVWVAARDAGIRSGFGIPGETIEGWLIPDTYSFGGYATARQVVRSFLIGRRDSWPADWRERASAADLDQAEVLALASIVEAEAQLSEELPRIAAVYRNRLRLRMPLQADPTINYAFLVDSGLRKSRLLNRDYAYQSPYNTYLHPGLPPTPIGNPSTAAIEAVLSPTESKELYFVARGDGGHIFATTYGQHLRNIRQVRR